MRAWWLLLLVLLPSCVKKPVNVVLPQWIAWCEGAERTMSAPQTTSPETGEYLEALRPCMDVMKQTELSTAGLVLGMTTNEEGELKAACVKNISFDEPPLLECVMRQIWASGVRLPPNLQRETYKLSFLLN